MSAPDILAALIGDAVMARAGKPEGDEIRFRCPAHEPDAHPSARWNASKATWCCDACSEGGGWTDLARRLGIEIRKEGGRGYSSPRNGSNLRAPYGLKEYSAEKGLPAEYLKGRGLGPMTYMGTPAVRIPFYDLDGTVVTSQYRMPSEKKFKAGSPTIIYGLDRLAHYRQTATSITICEGASDQQTLDYSGFAALGLPGASNWKDDRDAEYFDGFETIYVIIEPDAGGEAVRKWLERSRIRDRAHLITLDGFKDPSAMHIDSPESFKERYQAAMDAATAWMVIEAARTTADAEDAASTAGDLLEETDIISRAREAIGARGYAGDTRAPGLVFVAVASRLLARPMNLALVAPSAAGKNEAVRAGAALHPATAVHTMSAGSARALIYDDDDFTHRYLVVEEADSIPDEGPVAAAIRAIAETGAMTYDVVERDESTGKWGTRHIVKPGPTGLITTATKSVEYQLGTRVLELPITDSEDQTKAVMLVHARRAAGLLNHVPDPATWIAFNRWIELAGQRSVVVPFAVELIGLIPSHLVRLRRDSAQLLSCIQAVALLHQRHRSRTSTGEIVATIADYAATRDLLAPVFDIIATEGVSPAVRETVLAMNPEETITQAELAARLNLSKGTTSYRVNKAITAGFIVNIEKEQNRPKKLTRGAPLPEERPALPDPEEVRRRFEGSNNFPVLNTPSPRAPGAAVPCHCGRTATAETPLCFRHREERV